MTGKQTQDGRTVVRLVRAGLLAMLLSEASNVQVIGAPVIDETQLPPPATNQVDFARDIKPIFEQSCLRCHGPERPRNRFSLVTRESALKGGANGVDILPGDSAHSPLIHFVTWLVEEFEMPPPDRGTQLTPEQIGLLRAWIDQGVAWETNAPEPTSILTLSPMVGWTTVSGDEQKFRELQWQREGWNAGAESFRLTEKLGPESTLTVEGRALLEDSRVSLTLENKGIGFTRFGWEQYRKYYDSSGGYYPGFNPSVFSLDHDLHLDVGRAWADFGLTLPDWPRIVIGYEYQYREGEKSTLQWGGVSQGGETRNIYPSAKAVDEKVHILKFDLDHEIAGVRIADSFRGEFYDLSTSRQNIRFNESFIASSNAATGLDNVREGTRYFQGANSLVLERAFTDWFFGSAGYLYSHLDADATFGLEPLFPLGAPGFYAVERWQSQEVVLERETHAANLSSSLGPWEGLTLSAGALGDWTRQTGFGRATTELVTPFFTIAQMETLAGNSDTTKFEENAALRYTKIPFSVLFAEARLQQESRGLYEDTVGGFHDFMQRTDAESDLRDFRAGFNTSPWQRLSLSAYYRRSEKETEYDHVLDQSVHGAYPSFITWRAVDTDEAETKLAVRPCNWLKTSLAYKYVATEYRTATDPISDGTTPGGRLESADSAAHVYSLNATLTPWRRLYLSGTFSYEHSRLAAFANDAPSVVPYRGDRFSVLTSGNYALSKDTDWQASYSYSWADYGQDNYAEGLPLGMNYSQHALTTGVNRRFGKNIIGKLQYGFFHYDDPGSGGANNYTAHAIFGTLTMRFP